MLIIINNDLQCYLFSGKTTSDAGFVSIAVFDNNLIPVGIYSLTNTIVGRTAYRVNNTDYFQFMSYSNTIHKNSSVSFYVLYAPYRGNNK